MVYHIGSFGVIFALLFLLFTVAMFNLFSKFAFADMMADSPVTFPNEGALPAKYPPDQTARPDDPAIEGESSEEGYYIFNTPIRSLTQIATIQAEMPKGKFITPPSDWTYLQRTRRILTKGGTLRLLAMGDSIVNDTMRSDWVAKLGEFYPKADIRATIYVRGGGGCQHYKEENRIAKHVIPRKPDLVFIGGISQKDIDSIREVIHQLRSALPEVEILLASGTLAQQIRDHQKNLPKPLIQEPAIMVNPSRNLQSRNDALT